MRNAAVPALDADADATIDTTTENLADAVPDATGGNGAAITSDHVRRHR